MRESSILFYNQDELEGEPQYHQWYVTYERVYNVPRYAIDIIPILGASEVDLEGTIFDNEGVQTPRVMSCQWDRSMSGDFIPVTIVWYQVRLYSDDTSTTSPAELNNSRVTLEEMEWRNSTRYFCSTDGDPGIDIGDIFVGDGDTDLDRRICINVDNTDTTTLPGMVLSVISYKGVRLTGTTIGTIGEIVKHPIYHQDTLTKDVTIFGVANATGAQPARGTKFSADTSLNLAARILYDHQENPYYLPGLFLYELRYKAPIPLTADDEDYMEIMSTRSRGTGEEFTRWEIKAVYYDDTEGYEADDVYSVDTSYTCQSTQDVKEWLPGVHLQTAVFTKYQETGS